MSPAERHQRIKDLFAAVCDLPDARAQRAALAELGADGATTAEVMLLLGHADTPTHFAAPVAKAAEALLDDALRQGRLFQAQPWSVGGLVAAAALGGSHITWVMRPRPCLPRG